MKSRKLVVVWLDAFSDRYLSSELSPFLLDMSRRCYFAKTMPVFAYTGIGTCFETGVSVRTHKLWNDHTFRGFCVKQESGNSFLRWALPLIDRLSPNDEINKMGRYGAFRVSKVDYGIPHLIPPSLLDSFQIVARDRKWRSLYEILEEHGVRHLRIEPKLASTESLVVRRIPRLLSRNDALFVKLNSLDRLGHRFGPHSAAVGDRVRYLDRLLKWLDRSLGSTITIVMSDHGMVPVNSTFDLVGFLKSRGFNLGHDYMGYVGATYASFWYRDERCRRAMQEELSSTPTGKLLTFDERSKAGIAHIGREYGEDIFAVEEGHVIFPEFYHIREAPKGMHGYASSKYDMPIFIMNDGLQTSRIKERIHLMDIMPTILHLFDIPAPSYVEGKSLVQSRSDCDAEHQIHDVTRIREATQRL